MNDSFIAVEIGGTKLQIARGTADGTITERRRTGVDRAAGARGIRAAIETTVREMTAAAPPRAIGAGYGGPVDWETGKICCSYHVKGWSEFPLGEWLHEIAGVPVFVDNDANVASLGEAHRGAGAGRNPVFYVTLGSGVGGGLVVNGRIYHGMKPGEAEIGHIRLNKRGVIVEKRCAGWAVDRKIRRAIANEPGGILARLVGATRGGEAKHLAGALDQGDAAAQRILDETAGDLAFALGHATQLFHPGIIVLGGGLSLVGEPLRSAVAARVPRYIMSSMQPGPAIALAALREDAVPVGALILAAQGIPAR
ncbi:ROK family protein [bacterium]|nr:ROK family protein [bacterium]